MPEQYTYQVGISSLKGNDKYTTASNPEEAIRNVITRTLEKDKKFIFAGLVYTPNQLRTLISIAIKSYNKGNFKVKQLSSTNGVIENVDILTKIDNILNEEQIERTFGVIKHQTLKALAHMKENLDNPEVQLELEQLDCPHCKKAGDYENLINGLTELVEMTKVKDPIVIQLHNRIKKFSH